MSCIVNKKLFKMTKNLFIWFLDSALILLLLIFSFLGSPTEAACEYYTVTGCKYLTVPQHFGNTLVNCKSEGLEWIRCNHTTCNQNHVSKSCPYFVNKAEDCKPIDKIRQCLFVSTCENGIIDPGEECDPDAKPTGCKAGEFCWVNCRCVFDGGDDCSFYVSTNLCILPGKQCSKYINSCLIVGTCTNSPECVCKIPSNISTDTVTGCVRKLIGYDSATGKPNYECQCPLQGCKINGTIPGGVCVPKLQGEPGEIQYPKCVCEAKAVCGDGIVQYPQEECEKDDEGSISDPCLTIEYEPHVCKDCRCVRVESSPPSPIQF